MSIFPLKPTSSYVKAYYATLAQFHQHGHKTEGNTRSSFADLLKRCSSPYDWHLVEEYQFKGTNKQPLRADGALVDSLTLVHGLWEAKDSADDLEKEIKSKVAKGYPLTNILFQSPDRAILYQDNRITLDCDLTIPESLIEILTLFFEHRQPHEVDWEEAVLKFSEKIPDLAGGVTKILEAEHKKNADFREKFQAFADLCRQSINPDLTDAAIQKMLVQHLLTERIFRKVFDNQEFLSRNIIAAEIEKVIHSITAKHFSRDTFLKPLDRFYKAIEEAAITQTGYTEKQHFLNAVYEKFFQSFDRKQSDTHGIVYTPQPIVDFMVRSVEEILKSEFCKSLSDEGIQILDPFTGTGNFITRIMQQIKKSRLPQKYANELHCNEIMLLPYYIASMNIEHAYMERTNEYKPFEGICLVDTFELAEAEQQGFSFMVEENTKRVRKQRNSPITVIIGNPPYNANQHYENENNKNRKYKVISERVAKTYAKDSTATNKNTLSDPYIGAFRWASDRLGDEGIIALVTNNSFVDAIAGDGVRKHLRQDFNEVFVIDLGGDVRRNPKLSGTTNNVFGIQVGVSISLFVRRQGVPRPGRVYLKRVDEYWKSTEKLAWLDRIEVYSKAEASEVPNDPSGRWIAEQTDHEYSGLAPFSTQGKIPGLFEVHSNGVQSNRDPWVFNFDKSELLKNVSTLIETYNGERVRWHKLTPQKQRDAPLIRDDKKIKWCSKLQQLFDANTTIDFNPEAVEQAQYRPFTTQWLYGDKPLLHRPGQVAELFSAPNEAIVVTSHSQVPFSAQAVRSVTCLDVGGRPSQVFPFYTYDKGGTNRQENITDWALDQYRTHYKLKSTTKWDIFHSTYALLHHPEYRARYSANLKRELPRILFPPDIQAFAAAGKRLMELHIDYEQQPEYPLEEIEQPGKPWTLRVEKMSLSNENTELRYNEALTLRGIPPAAFDYRLGNRSALEWVIDQYRVSTDPRSGISNDPNRTDDERYVLRLIGQVITVSLETQQIITSLPSLDFPA